MNSLLNEEYVADLIAEYIFAGSGCIAHEGGLRRVVYINSYYSGFVVHALPCWRPLLLPFVLNNCLVRIKYEDTRNW